LIQEVSNNFGGIASFYIRDQLTVDYIFQKAHIYFNIKQFCRALTQLFQRSFHSISRATLLFRYSAVSWGNQKRLLVELGHFAIDLWNPENSVFVISIQHNMDFVEVHLTNLKHTKSSIKTVYLLVVQPSNASRN